MPHFYSTAKRLLVGRPLESAAAPHQRLSKTVGLAIFSSDAVASSAFATQEILHILVPVIGMAAIGYLGPAGQGQRSRVPRQRGPGGHDPPGR